jgi:alpha-L-fucosidase
LFVPGLKTAPVRATVLAGRDQTALACSLGEDGLAVAVPPGGDTISTTVVLKFRGSPEVEAVALRQRSDGTVHLPAADARLHGQQVRYETGEKRDNIGFWLNPADYVDWEFLLRQPGRFRVKASLAAPQPAAFEVVVGDQRLSAKARVTGDYGAFETVELGSLTLSSPGKVVLAVRPIAANWQPINLKAVWLEPQ